MASRVAAGASCSARNGARPLTNSWSAMASSLCGLSGCQLPISCSLHDGWVRYMVSIRKIMFICRRFLQIGTVSLVLAGCASAPPGPTAARPSPEPSSGNAPIRIGPARPADAPAAASTPTGALRPDARGYAEQLGAERGLALEPVVAALESARYNAPVARLIAPSPPGRKVWRSWNTYRARFVEPKRINWGLQFWEENQTLLTQAAQRYGVPASIIASIIGVETLYGRNMGSFRVLDALATLAFDYPDPAKPERAEMFRGQLGDFIT